MSSRMNALIELYHASSRFPNRQAMLSSIDKTLLGSQSLSQMDPKNLSPKRPKLHTWQRLFDNQTSKWSDAANSAVQSAAARSPLSSRESRASAQGIHLRPSIVADNQRAADPATPIQEDKIYKDAVQAWNESRSTISAKQIQQKERLQRMRDALHGTSSGGQAGLPLVKEQMRSQR